MSEQQLMQSIKTRWGPLVSDACHSSSVPPAFLAALIANESGGESDARRFENNVFAAFWSILMGRTQVYGSLRRDDVLTFLGAPVTSAEFAELTGLSHLVTATMLRLDGLATSQGLTQIMGYEALAFHLDSIEALKDPPESLIVTLKMLTQFAERFSLDLSSDFDQLLDCWNTGRPHGKTFDPDYVSRGIDRMKIYDALPSATELRT